MPKFISGIELNQIYYWEAVRPILDAHFPGLPHAAALLGYGSDVIGFDTPTSTDHMWGPRLILFLSPEQMNRQEELNETFRQHLPVSIRGYSTHFSKPDPGDRGVRINEKIDHGPVDPLIFFHTVASFFQQELGIDPTRPLRAVDWLTFQEHRLLSVTAGKVYYDLVGLEETRQRFKYYPNPVWRYLLAAQWGLISQEEAFVGRTHSVGDELGSRVITARQVERLMRLCFLMEKRYPPYSKWFGKAFQRLACYPRMGPLLERAIQSDTYTGREAALAQAYILAVEMHNSLGITGLIDPRTRTYSGWHHWRSTGEELPLDQLGNTRPYQVIFGERLANPIYDSITDPEVRALRPMFGSANQFLVESSPAVEDVEFCRGLAGNLT
jgi:hypothetical protein